MNQTEQQQVYLAENMSQSYTHCGCDHGDSHTIHQPVEITTGQVDHNVSPDQGQADQGVERHEDDKDGVGRLEFCPQQHGVYIVSRLEELSQNVVIWELRACTNLMKYMQ